MVATEKPKAPHRRTNPESVDPSINPDFSTVPLEAEQPSWTDRLLHATWEIIKTLAFIVLAAVIIRAFFLQPFFVQGESMEPNFQDGNYLLVNQISYHFSAPARGDVIVFKAPPEPETNYIKRVIGVPGDTVELKSGHYVVSNARHPSGVTLNESYELPGTTTLPIPESGNLTKWQLGPDQYFAGGDNREPGKSSDSRAWGLVPRQVIIGKAWLRVYPLAAVGAVKHQSFPELSWLASPVSLVLSAGSR